MIVLGIETAATVCAAAVVDGGVVLSERSLTEPHIHSERLMRLIDDAIATTGLEIEKLEGIAVSIGPGSFTGLRIGLSVAKGLAYAADKPILPIPTLEALAWRAFGSGLAHECDMLLPMLDARRAEVYLAGYRVDGEELNEMIPPSAVVLSQLQRVLPAAGRIVAVGDGVEKFQQFLLESNPDYHTRIAIPTSANILCRASTIGLLGEKRLMRGEVADLASLEPLYVKDFYTLVRTQHEKVIL